MAIAHFKGAQTLAALPLARAAPDLVFKADLQPQPEAASVPCESGLRLALTSDSESGCHSQAQAGSTRSGRQNRTRSRSLLPAVTLPNRTT